MSALDVLFVTWKLLKDGALIGFSYQRSWEGEMIHKILGRGLVLGVLVNVTKRSYGDPRSRVVAVYGAPIRTKPFALGRERSPRDLVPYDRKRKGKEQHVTTDKVALVPCAERFSSVDGTNGKQRCVEFLEPG